MPLTSFDVALVRDTLPKAPKLPIDYRARQSIRNLGVLIAGLACVSVTAFTNLKRSARQRKNDAMLQRLVFGHHFLLPGLKRFFQVPPLENHFECLTAALCLSIFKSTKRLQSHTTMTNTASATRLDTSSPVLRTGVALHRDMTGARRCSCRHCSLAAAIIF